ERAVVRQRAADRRAEAAAATRDEGDLAVERRRAHATAAMGSSSAAGSAPTRSYSDAIAATTRCQVKEAFTRRTALRPSSRMRAGLAYRSPRGAASASGSFAGTR